MKKLPCCLANGNAILRVAISELQVVAAKIATERPADGVRLAPMESCRCTQQQQSESRIQLVHLDASAERLNANRRVHLMFIDTPRRLGMQTWLDWLTQVTCPFLCGKLGFLKLSQFINGVWRWSRAAQHQVHTLQKQPNRKIGSMNAHQHVKLERNLNRSRTLRIRR